MNEINKVTIETWSQFLVESEHPQGQLRCGNPSTLTNILASASLTGDIWQTVPCLCSLVSSLHIKYQKQTCCTVSTTVYLWSYITCLGIFTMSNKIDGGNKKEGEGFPGGPMVKNLPANAEDTGLITDPGRFPMPWSNQACVSRLLSPRAATTEAHEPRTCALQREKPPQWKVQAQRPRVASAHHN